jgi:hypothetical protein
LLIRGWRVNIRILLKTLTSIAYLRGITLDDSASVPVFRGSKVCL